MGKESHENAFINGEFGVDTRDLKRSCDAKVASAVSRQFCNLFLLEQDLPRGRSVISCDKIEIGGFPRAIRSDDRVDIPFEDFETHFVHSPKFSKFFCDPLCLEKHTISLPIDSVFLFFDSTFPV